MFTPSLFLWCIVLMSKGPAPCVPASLLQFCISQDFAPSVPPRSLFQHAEEACLSMCALSAAGAVLLCSAIHPEVGCGSAGGQCVGQPVQ